MLSVPSKPSWSELISRPSDTTNKCWLDAGPPSTTLVQHQVSICSFRGCWGGGGGESLNSTFYYSPNLQMLRILLRTDIIMTVQSVAIP